MITTELKKRLDSLVDGIVAIIITIMVLELPATSWNDHAQVWPFFVQVAIYAVSFCFVANIWYQQSILFSTVKQIPRKVVTAEFALLFALSLIPAITRLMSGDVERISVTIYGCLYFVIIMLVRYITETIVHQQTNDTEQMKKIYTSIYGEHNLENGIFIAVLIILGVFLPQVAYVLYIAIPIRSFMTIDSQQRELTGIQEMAAPGQQNYLRMNRQQQAAFRRNVGRYIQAVRAANGDETQIKAAWESFSRAIVSETGIDAETLATWFKNFKAQRDVHTRRGPAPFQNDR